MKRCAAAIVALILIVFIPTRSVIVRADSPTDTSTTVVAFGDSACDPTNPSYNNGNGDDQNCQQKATSDLAVALHPAAVLALGDNQYENGTLGAFMASYDPTWGRLKSITYPTPGNHEYQSPGAAGYFQYFGSAAGSPTAGYYSANISSWHLISLNSECAFISGGCGVGSPQERWLLSDLASSRDQCTVAIWHEPRFTSGRNKNHPALQALWDDLYAYGVDVVLNGHDHIYERFKPMNDAGAADTKGGIQEFIVGTGGNNHQPAYGAIWPTSIVRDNKTYGVLDLTLHSASYDWKFIPAVHKGNGTFTDSGSGQCHGINAGTENGLGPRAVPVVSAATPVGVVARFGVDFTSTNPGRGYVLFGAGSGCSGLIMTATADDGAGTTHHHLDVTGDDLAAFSPWGGGDVGISPGATYSYETVTQTSSGREVDNNGGKCYSVKIPTG